MGTPEHTIGTEAPTELAARLVDVTVRDGHTDLALRIHGEPVTIEVGVVPDDDAARRRTHSLRRVSWLRIDLDVARPTSAACHLMATPHRLPVRSPVTLAVALSLARSGVPTSVHLRF